MIPSDDVQSRILIVEDNPSDVMLIKMALKKAGLTFLADVARDGEVALKLFSLSTANQDQKEYDLILLDLNIPKRCPFGKMACFSQQ